MKLTQESDPVTVHLIHGIHTEGPSVVEPLARYLPGFDVRYPDYGWIAGLETKVANPIIVGCLLPYVVRSDILIGHSNGCAVIYDMLNRGVQCAGAVFINAALEQNIALPKGCPWIHVYSNVGDQITEAAKLAAKLGLVDTVWGEMGHGGYMGTDPRISNFFCDRTPGMPVVAGHSDFFTPVTKLPFWGPFLYREVRAALS
jgi:hypothetical protein